MAKERYALIETDGPTDTGKRYRIEPAEATERNGFLSGKTPALKLVPVVEDAEPTIDEAVEYLSKNTGQTVTLDALTRTHTVRQYSAAQLASQADEADRLIKKNRIGGKVQWLRDKSTQAAGVTVTTGNAVNVLQGVVDNLSQFYDGFADLIEHLQIDGEFVPPEPPPPEDPLP